MKIPGLPTDRDQVSYMIGMQMAKSLEPVKDEIDVDVIAKAVRTSLKGDKLLMTDEQAQKVAEAFGQRMQKKQIEKMLADAQKNLAEGEKFLAENAKKPNVKTTPSGVQYEVVKQGSGPLPKPTDTVRVHYKGMLLDGKTFDSSYDRGEPTNFELPQMILGWREGIALMPVGSKYKLWLPAKMAYGETGTPGGPIPPNSALAFEVELIDIVKGEGQAKAQGEAQ
jgi:FKBP-type peptidyl-prolyl cis-trans isomerase FkpA/FKBP-type peptidyl-prolyl cis-trans isomerase FklB